MFGFRVENIDTFWEILGFIVLVIFFTWLISRIIRFFLRTLFLNMNGADTKTSILFMRNSVKFVLGILAIFYIVYTVPLFRSKAIFIISSAGVFAALLGFIAQSALANIASGVFIVIFKPFRVGDKIQIDKKLFGIVSEITLRSTIINNFENKRYIIPNSIISKESILNHTIEDEDVLSFNNFILGMYADIDLARKIIVEEANKLEFIIDKRTTEEKDNGNSIIEVYVVDTKESVIHLRAYVWIDGPKNEFISKAILREAVHKRFIKEGVNLPVPLRKFVD